MVIISTETRLRPNSLLRSPSGRVIGISPENISINNRKGGQAPFSRLASLKRR